MPNLQLTSKKRVSSFRRIAIGTWRTVKDPSVYGSLTIEMDEALRYMRAFREQTGKRLTITHMMAKAVGDLMEKVPDVNSILRFNRIYQRKEIALSFQVVMEDPDTGEIDLSVTAVRHPEQKTLEEIVDEFQASAEKVRKGKDKQLEGTRSSFKKIPYFLLGRVLDAISFFCYTLNLDMRWAGIPKDPFGSAMITNIGSLGLEAAYVPLVPYSRVPLVIAIGAMKDEAIVREGTLQVGKVMRLYATFDHRILDGAHAAAMVKIINKWFKDPFTHFDPLPAEQKALDAKAEDAKEEDAKEE